MTTETAMQTEDLDPITFEVLRSSLTNLVDAMGVRLQRVAFSPVITEGRDYTLALCAPNGDVVACGARDLPAHLGQVEFTVRDVIERFAGDIEPGDVFLLNDPHAAGSHNNDVRCVWPVFADDELFAWVVSVGHWTDIGGPLPGSFNPEATSCFGEGLRIPPVKIMRDGALQQNVVDMILGNVRLPEQSGGDLQAQIEACRAGSVRLRELLERYGRSTLAAAFERTMDYSERLLANEIASLAPGAYEWTDYCDEDTGDPERKPVKVHLRLTIGGGKLIFDYTESDPAPRGPGGNPLPMTWSATISGLLNLCPGVPFNHGVLRLIDVRVKTPSCVSVPFPGAVCATGSGVHQKVECCVLNTIGQADPSRRTGAIYNLQNLTIGGEDGADAEQRWVMYLWTAGGYGGTARGDAGLPSMMLFAAGTMNQPVEVLERANPVIFDRVAIAQDSMGAGRHRGGAGEERVFHVTGGPATLTAIGDRFVYPIWGVDGGHPGQRQEIIVDYGGAGERCLGTNISRHRVLAGERIYMRTGGGGGYGLPTERDPDAVLDDVLEGYMSSEGAADAYGVVIAQDAEGRLIVDLDATLRRRAAMVAS